MLDALHGGVSMIVAVTGGRDHNRPGVVWGALDLLHAYRRITKLISGACVDKNTMRMCGADLFAIEWAAAREVDFDGRPARWFLDGYPQAGPIRNRRMLRENPVRFPDYLVHFAGGRGTADCIRASTEVVAGTNYSIRVLDGENYAGWVLP